MAKNLAIEAEKKFKTSVQTAQDYVENFDILETINNVGNDEVFTPNRLCNEMLDLLPKEVWINPHYKWLNPVDKNGVFLREIAIRLDKGLVSWEKDLEKRRKHILQKMIYSIGLTRFTAQVSRRTVYYCSVANRGFDNLLDENNNSLNGYAIGNGAWFDSSEGNIITPSSNHFYEGDRCIYCGISKDSKYNDPKQVENYAYEFIHQENLYDYLNSKFFKGSKNMKFDIIIGNPPYQLKVNEGGKGLGAIPIYHKFIELAKSLRPKYLSMIVPSRWLLGGVGLDDFRTKMLNDKHIAKIVDYVNSRDCFPNFDINGGVCYFLWDSETSTNECEYTYISNSTKVTSQRVLNEYEIFIRNSEALKIVKKVLLFNEDSISKIVSSQTPYGLNSDYRGKPSKSKNSYTFYSSDGVSYIEKSEVEKGIDLIDNYRVMLPKITSEHAGIPDKNGQYKVLTPLKVLRPGEICSQSYLVVGPVDNENQAYNLKTYLESKLVRYLLLSSIPGMNISKDKFRFIPILNFSKKYTDQEIYKKYNLSESEINVIEKTIRTLE